MTFKKNPDYWDVEVVAHRRDPGPERARHGSQINGLRAGTIDMVLNISAANAKAVAADPSSPSASSFAENAYFYINMCTGKPPFDNERVRRALDIGIDRENINKLVYERPRRAGVRAVAEGHPYYNPQLATKLKFDPEKAKQLLAAGGSAVGELRSALPNVLADIGRMAEADSGADRQARLRHEDHGRRHPQPVRQAEEARSAHGSGVASGRGQVRAGPRKGSLVALCDVDHQEVVDSLAPASAAVPGDPSVAPLFQAADATIAKHGYYIPLVFVPDITGYSKARLGGTLTADGKDGYPQYNSVYVKKK